jgi:hypothetical protein
MEDDLLPIGDGWYGLLPELAVDPLDGLGLSGRGRGTTSGDVTSDASLPLTAVMSPRLL